MAPASVSATVVACRYRPVAGRWVTPRALAPRAREERVSVPEASRTEERNDALIFYPALVNAHDHLHLNGLGAPQLGKTFRSSYQWIATILEMQKSPTFSAYHSLPSRVRTWQGALKNLLAGTTVVLHHDPWQVEFIDPAFPVCVPSKYAWAHSPVLAGLVDGVDVGDEAPLLPPELRYGPSITESFPPPDGSPWMIHVAEGTDAASLREFYTLDRAGCIGPDTVLIHGVALDAGAQERILESGAHLVWCPASNLALLGTTLEPARLASAGRLSLGTDSRLSGSRDLLCELRVAARNSKLDHAVLFDLVTVNAARAARLPDSRFLAGAEDYFIATDRGGDPFEHLLALGRGDIRAVVRRGKPAIADPDFAPWFFEAGIEARRMTLDGRPKLCDAALVEPFLAPDAPALAKLEPGAEVPRC